MRFYSLVLVGVFAALMQGCGLVNTAYNNAPELMRWWLDDYFDFTPTQKGILTPELQRLHGWHREAQLPDYMLMLKNLQSSMRKETMAADYACGKIDQIKASYGELQQKTVPIITEIAPQLTDKQMQYFRTKLEKRAQKWKDDWLQDSPEEQLKVRLEKMADFAEKVYGSLNEPQLALLKQGIADSAINPALTYAEIQRRNEDVYQILNTLRKSNLSAEQSAQLVRDGFARLQKSPNPTYQAYADHVMKRTCGVIADLHTTTTSQQKQHAHDYLENYIVQFTRLSTKINGATGQQ